MNVVLRAMALSGAVEQCGRLFEEYGAAGLAPDAGSYNAVLEACVVARQVGGCVVKLGWCGRLCGEAGRSSWQTGELLRSA
jgi:hypothetical protein